MASSEPITVIGWPLPVEGCWFPVYIEQVESSVMTPKIG